MTDKFSAWFFFKDKRNLKYSFLFPVILESLKKNKFFERLENEDSLEKKTLERETHDIVKFMILKNIACINHGQLNLMIYMYLSLVILRCISEIVYFFLLRRRFCRFLKKLISKISFYFNRYKDKKDKE